MGGPVQIGLVVVPELAHREDLESGEVVEVEILRGVLVADIATVSHVDASIVAKPAPQAPEVLGAKVDTDIAVEVELALRQGAVDQLKIAR